MGAAFTGLAIRIPTSAHDKRRTCLDPSFPRILPLHGTDGLFGAGLVLDRMLVARVESPTSVADAVNAKAGLNISLSHCRRAPGFAIRLSRGYGRPAGCSKKPSENFDGRTEAMTNVIARGWADQI